ncbi:hypothetical protein [Luteirhabdus pelagi]|uniref:hypothetical protein n=1 Tax=Luteirhabdus pelagi TaxID=2792783 RepID=UPI001939B4BA|nr:hypothetical protein [Luteirhabdus pelagi]
MKNLFFILLTVFITKEFQAQTTNDIFIKDSTITSSHGDFNGQYKDVILHDSDDPKTSKDAEKATLADKMIIGKCTDSDRPEKWGDLYFEIDCDQHVVTISAKKDKKEYKFYYCSNDSTFYGNQIKFESACKQLTTTSKIGKFTLISEIPFPTFEYNTNDSEENKLGRKLYIDGTPYPLSNSVTRLKKIKRLKNGTLEEKMAFALPTKGSLMVYLENYNINELKKIEVNVAGKEYTYNTGLDQVFGKKTTTQAENQSSKNNDYGHAANTPDESFQTDSDIKTYLNTVQDYYNKKEALSLNDIKLLEDYKAQLYQVYSNNRKSNILAPQEFQTLSEILSWFPNYIALSPIPLSIENKDEIDLSVVIQHEGSPEKSYKVGSYYTTRGLSVDFGGTLFITGLRNNKVYLRETEMDSQQEIRATLEENNQMSLGYGLNGEVSYRTGGILRPTFNIGAFVPFDEEITAFASTGIGFGLFTEKVKISSFFGLAFGKVNSINEKYIDQDLTDLSNILTNSDYTTKVWESGWVVGLGIRFYFKDKNSTDK